MTATLDSLHFDDLFQRRLPADPSEDKRPRQVLGAGYSRVAPTPVAAPHLIAYSREAAALIDLPPSECESESFVQVFSGNRVLPSMRPYAACYGGHQFGNWAGQLGDGRAITLGEVVASSGQRWELQLKGAGLTPYSRTADGRAVLRSSVREFLCSEAMHHLGVPTTRALCLIGTGEPVIRDMFYDGNPAAEPGAIVCRMAPSFLRFGNFEIFRARGDSRLLAALGEHTLATHFPELGPPTPEAYAALFETVCRRTALLMAHWMRVGFVHGVMNTDNMSVLGLTIDYGPYGWLEDFDPSWTPNTTDRGQRRYRYAHQPAVALWNLARFAEALYPLVERPEPLERALRGYHELLRGTLFEMFRDKLGLSGPPDGEAPMAADSGEAPALGVDLGDGLIEELCRVLQLAETDMTIFFRRLADVPLDRDRAERSADADVLAPLGDAFYIPEQLTPDRSAQLANWVRRYVRRAAADPRSLEQRRAAMNRVNPKFVLRNYLAQTAIDRATDGDYSRLHELLDVLRRPYDEQPERAELAEKRPDWARHRPGCSMLSCSS